MRCENCGKEIIEWRTSRYAKVPTKACSRACLNALKGKGASEALRVVRPSLSLDPLLIEEAYWLGLMGSDGCVTSNKHRIHLAQSGEAGKALMKWVEENVYHVQNAIRACKTAGNPSYSIQFTDEKISNYLIATGITPKKSLTFQFDFSILKNRDQKLAFIRGYTDGDGSINLINNRYLRWEIVGTEQIIKGIQNLLEEICFIKIPAFEYRKFWYLKSQNRETPIVLNEIYNNQMKLFLSDKGRRFFSFKEEILPTIRSVKPKGSKYGESDGSSKIHRSSF